MIEKRITQQLLEAGELVLTPTERVDLALPEHSTTIKIELEGEVFGAQWSGRTRQLSGDMLTERLQDYGQAGGLVRLRYVDQAYRLLLLPPGSGLQVSRQISQPAVVHKVAPKSKAARRRATIDRQFHSDDEYDWGSSDPRTIGFLAEARTLFGEQLKAAGFDPLELVELRLQGEELATLDDFEELLAVDVANVDRMPHQEAVARHALSRLRGRAVLADEVGLGKTIEAGLAVKELTLRGLAKRVLILCPAPLRDQWREEMHNKFDLPFDVAYRGYDIGRQDKLIVSLTLATREIDKLTKKPWDIVIVDEAHRAAGAGARKRRELITALTTACRYAFFLTATPVQNDLLELYRLVELLRPGTFTSVSAFKREFMTGYDPRKPKDPAALRRLISSAMIRTTRAQAGVDRVVRRAVDVPIELGPRERELYVLSTDLLRNIMNSPGDTMRRRSLALRLTASPFSMGTTALRMAERHPDPRVRAALSEVGHLAMDIAGSARENKALDITRGWIKDHGRVLIFTQHTDTVTGLLRRIEAEGLKARSFHGSMSPSERAATIAAFRSGEAPIMISTDAGAEGQNLQFCNCVLNYDLPWNPMRIEQRIGRVDRLTQPRDEVFVANLYARGTIDESVYRLLAEKLRMFELLFGQVTTILGELDDSKSATFESRVLEALFADSNSKMDGLLSQLGAELADARERASTLIAADSGLSNWMAAAFEHRKELTKEGSAELRPEATERARLRQRRVQSWVRSVLKALAAQLLHDTGEGEGAFLTAEFDEEFAEELGGRTLMHLAFDRHGLEHHPDAELCAVGSPVFDELLGLLRMRGDLHATVPVIPDEAGPSPFQHAATISLVRRRLIPAGSWSGHATFRATVGEAETSEHILTADVNGHNEIRLPRRPLNEGESLPSSFALPAEMVAAFERDAASQLEKLRRDRTEQVERDQARELDRIRNGYRAQIAEASYEDSLRLQRALKSEERRLSRRPDVRARAKLLAITLDEDDWLVEETWANHQGEEAQLTYEWGLREPPEVVSDASDEPITVLALCSAPHWVDASDITRCGSCGSDLCIACGDDAVFADCPTCALPACGACRNDTGGLCRQCGSPERAPELDTQFSVGWKLGQGVTLTVGERAAELKRPGESAPSLVVRDEDLTGRSRIRLRSYSIHSGLPADSGLILADRTARPPSHDVNRIALRASKAVHVEFSVANGSASTIDASAVDDLPLRPARAAAGEQASSLAPLLERLRLVTPPPHPPAVVVTRRAHFSDVYIAADRLIEQASKIADDGTLTVIHERTAAFEWRQESLESPILATAQLAGLRVALERRNEAVVVTVSDDAHPQTAPPWIALPDGASVEDQFGWFDWLRSRGAPGGRVGRSPNEPIPMVDAWPSPSECQLVARSIRPVAELMKSPDSQGLLPVDRASLTALGGRAGIPNARIAKPMPTELSRALLEKTNRSFNASVRNGFDVHETWQGHGTATHQYQAFDGRPVAPMLDDAGRTETNFGVCRDGHFYSAGTAGLCASCDTWSCRACDDIDHRASIECQSCTRPVCRRCLSKTHNVFDDQCVMCGDRECAQCGRNPEVLPCPICARIMCSVCRVNELCPACSGLTHASDNQLNSLPKGLAANGATVFIGFDDNATTVVINRGDGAESAVIRNEAIDSWVAFGRTELSDTYRLRLYASSQLGAQVMPTIEPLGVETPIEATHVMLQSGRLFRPAWSATGLGKSDRSNRTFLSPEPDLAGLIADEFPAITQLPTAVDTAAFQVQQIVDSMPKPDTVELVLRWHRTGQDIAVSDSGLVSRVLDGSDLTESLTAWSDIEVAPTWVSDTWEPVPTVRKYAALNDVEAVVVSIASLLALGVRIDGQTDWYTITPSPEAPAATMLARSMGQFEADAVGAFTDPKVVTRSTVSNATNVSLRVHPLASVKPSARRELSQTTTGALEYWLPGVKPVVPELGELPHKFRAALEQSVRSSRSRIALLIGARFEEEVTVEGGPVWAYQIDLTPGETDARRVDSVSRVRRTAGIIDREGHYGSDGFACPYCAAKLCALCTDGLVTCDCCGVSICKRCIGEPHTDLWLCPACMTLRPPTRSEAREHGRFLLTRQMLISSDSRHTVVVEQTKHRWMRHAGDGEKQAIANPAVGNYLSERL